MTLTRDTIISALRTELEACPQVIALWLEGADATGRVDEYSDIDVCCSVDAGAMDQVTSRARQALESLGTLDLVQRRDNGSTQQQTVFHLSGTPPYLLVDFNLYVARGSTFIEGDEIEKPLVLFDRGGAVRFVTPEESAGSSTMEERLQALAQTVSQGSRIEKYARRGNFLEAFGYYHKWLLTPLIEALRLRYTPLHPDYYIVHISRHLPAEVVARLEDLFKIGSLEELERKSREAERFFAETAAYLRGENKG